MIVFLEKNYVSTFKIADTQRERVFILIVCCPSLREGSGHYYPAPERLNKDTEATSVHNAREEMYISLFFIPHCSQYGTRPQTPLHTLQFIHKVRKM